MAKTNEGFAMDIQRFDEPTITRQLEQEIENRNAIENTNMTIEDLQKLKSHHRHLLAKLLFDIQQDIKAKTGITPIISINRVELSNFDEPNRVLYTTNIEIPI